MYTSERIQGLIGYKCECGGELGMGISCHLGGRPPSFSGSELREWIAQTQGEFLFVGCMEGGSSCLEGFERRTTEDAISVYKELRR